MASSTIPSRCAGSWTAPRLPDPNGVSVTWKPGPQQGAGLPVFPAWHADTPAVYRIPTFVWFIRAAITSVGAFGCVFGLVFFLGGQERFQAPSLLYARTIPGGAYTWGTVFLLAGSGTLLGVIHAWHPKTLAFSLWALSTAYLFFSISIWMSLARSASNSPLTGGVTYLELSALALLCGVVARRLGQ